MSTEIEKQTCVLPMIKTLFIGIFAFLVEFDKSMC